MIFCLFIRDAYVELKLDGAIFKSTYIFELTFVARMRIYDSESP